MEIVLIPLSKLVTDKANPREELIELEELANSIEQNGQEYPIKVEDLKDGTHLVTEGHRRKGAFSIIGKRNKTDPEVQCIVENKLTDTERLLKRCLIEVQTKNWEYWERDKAWMKLIEEAGYTKEDLTKVLGANPMAVKAFLDRVELPKDIKKLKLGMNMLAETKGVEPKLRTELLKRVNKNNLGRQEVREIVKLINSTESDKLQTAVVKGLISAEHAEKIKDLSEERQESAIFTIDVRKKELDGALKELKKNSFKKKQKEDKKVLNAGQFVERLRDAILDTSNQMVAIQGILEQIEKDELEKHFTPKMKEILSESLSELQREIKPAIELIEKNVNKWRKG